VTGEHILIELLRDRDALTVMLGCNVACDRLRADVAAYLDMGVPAYKKKRPAKPHASATAERILQRALIYAVSAGREVATGTHVAMALYAEPEFPAAAILTINGLSRQDIVEYMRYGMPLARRAPMILPSNGRGAPMVSHVS
jgi:ATP-dependent Clp protease ATP-binding subunit ClpA